MKKSLILISALATVALSSCNSTGSAKLDNDTDSLSYALGVRIGEGIANDLKTTDDDIDPDILAKAISDGLKGNVVFSSEVAEQVIRNYFENIKPEKTKAASEKWIEEALASNPNAQKTESGLVYEIVEAGGEKAQSLNDTIVANYRGEFPNGNVFDSSYERNRPVPFVLSGRVIPAWKEGLQLIGKGGKVKLWVPSDLAYGEQGTGMGGPIGPNQALYFEAEILDIKPAPEEE